MTTLENNQIPKIKKYIEKYNLSASDIMLISEISHKKKTGEEQKFKSDKKIKFFDWVGFLTAIQIHKIIDESNISIFFENHQSIDKSEKNVAENKINSQKENKGDVQSKKQSIDKKQTKTNNKKEKSYTKSEISNAEKNYSKAKLKRIKIEAEFVLFENFVKENNSKLKDSSNMRFKEYMSQNENIKIQGSKEIGFHIVLKKVFNRDKGFFVKTKVDVIDTTILAPKNLFKDNYIVETEDEEYMIKEFKKLKTKFNQVYDELVHSSFKISENKNNEEKKLKNDFISKKLSDEEKKLKNKFISRNPIDYFEIDIWPILMKIKNKYKNKEWLLTREDLESQSNALFGIGKFSFKGNMVEQLEDQKYTFLLRSGVVFSPGRITVFSDSNNYSFTYFNYEGYDYDNLRTSESLACKNGINDFFIKFQNDVMIFDKTDKFSIKLNTGELAFMKELVKNFNEEVEKLYTSKMLKYIREIINERKRREELQKDQKNALKKLDKDNNGLVDVIENDDFMKLFKKHQKKIIEVDKKHIQDFVKISNYLKTKENNIQELFKQIKKTSNKAELNENVKLLENQIHTYNLLLYNSLGMIVALEDDLILFYQLYEAFDKLNIFNTNWENEVSNKLEDIGDGLRGLMYSIDDMEYNITRGLNQLNQSTREGFKNLNTSISRELKSIDSSIRVNNLFTTVSTYQLYKINKQTKGLNS